MGPCSRPVRAAAVWFAGNGGRLVEVAHLESWDWNSVRVVGAIVDPGVGSRGLCCHVDRLLAVRSDTVNGLVGGHRGGLFGVVSANGLYLRRYGVSASSFLSLQFAPEVLDGAYLDIAAYVLGGLVGDVRRGGSRDP